MRLQLGSHLCDPRHGEIPVIPALSPLPGTAFLSKDEKHAEIAQKEEESGTSNPLRNKTGNKPFLRLNPSGSGSETDGKWSRNGRKDKKREKDWMHSSHILEHKRAISPIDRAEDGQHSHLSDRNGCRECTSGLSILEKIG